MAIRITGLGSQRRSPVIALASVLVVAGLYGALRSRASGDAADDVACASAKSDTCRPDGEVRPVLSEGAAVPRAPVLTADETCHDVGYLCAELEHTDHIRVQRWRGFTGPMVVYVPRPDFEEPGAATRLQEAAVVGLRAWNGQPFQILTDVRGDRRPLFAVKWTRALGGGRIGVAHTQWSAATGLRVLSIELTTRNPYAPDQLVDPAQVRITAAHEMGHALGLPHSDSPRDVMYPTNTATSLTAQDYRTMESLYRLEDGTEITR